MENYVTETRLEFLQYVAGYYDACIYEKEGMYYLEDGEDIPILEMSPNDLMFLSETELRSILEPDFLKRKLQEEEENMTDKERGECSDCDAELEEDWDYCPYCGNDLN